MKQALERLTPFTKRMWTVGLYAVFAPIISSFLMMVWFTYDRFGFFETSMAKLVGISILMFFFLLWSFGHYSMMKWLFTPYVDPEE